MNTFDLFKRFFTEESCIEYIEKLRWGAEVNVKGWYGCYPIHWSKSEEMTKLLLSYGADINASDDCGYTALIRSAYNNTLPVAKVLLAHGADVNVKSCRGDTALMLARQYNNEKMEKVLIEAGAIC